jgi:hypothetical protein
LLLFVTVIALLLGPLFGTLLLFASHASFDFINLISSVIYAVVLPYAAIATTYLYFDLRVAKQGEEAEAGDVLPAEVPPRGGRAALAQLLGEYEDDRPDPSRTPSAAKVRAARISNGANSPRAIASSTCLWRIYAYAMKTTPTAANAIPITSNGHEAPSVSSGTSFPAPMLTANVVRPVRHHAR